jgi:methylmalonyl-CoA/ethylmalonyl-CoA epimerase
MPPGSGAAGSSDRPHLGTDNNMLSYPLDHVAVAVTSLEEACRLFEPLAGESSSPTEEIPAQGVRVCYVGSLELMEPLEPDSPVGRFLDRGGSGLHHIAFRVPDLSEAIARLEAEGFDLIDRTPRLGARGHKVAFLHPRSTGGTLVELVQAQSGSTS